MYASMTDGAQHVGWDFYPCVGTFLISLFFQAMIDSIVSMSKPTGADLDDVNPEALLVETDESLLLFLGGAKETVENAAQSVENAEILEEEHKEEANLFSDIKDKLVGEEEADQKEDIELTEKRKADQVTEVADGEQSPSE